MSKNPVFPYAVIAIIGILVMIGISYLGLNQRDAMSEDGSNENETTEVVAEADEIYKNSCASCHGGDLSGESGPALTQVGSKLSEDEIENIIIQGIEGSMPGGLVSNEEAAALAEWLKEQ